MAYAVIGHTEAAVRDYELKQEKATGRRMIITSIRDAQDNLLTRASLRALSIMGEQISWPMLTETKKADNIWACNALFQELDAKFIEWRQERATFFDGENPLLFACFDEQKRAVHQSYIDKVRAEDSYTDKLTAALILRLLIVGRKTLHRHKAEQLEGDHLQEMGDVLNCM